MYHVLNAQISGVIGLVLILVSSSKGEDTGAVPESVSGFAEHGQYMGVH